MKKLSLQWRITLMTAVLIGLTCVAMNCLLSYSGRYYMDSIGSYVSAFSDTEEEEPGFFDPEQKKADKELNIIIKDCIKKKPRQHKITLKKEK